MDFAEIHSEYGGALSFHGTIGTQTTMPFGTPDEVRHAVFCNLDIAGPSGELFVAPTHMLEPEVPPKMCWPIYRRAGTIRNRRQSDGQIRKSGAYDDVYGLPRRHAFAAKPGKNRTGRGGRSRAAMSRRVSRLYRL